MRLHHFHRQNSGQSFPHVITAKREVGLLEQVSIVRVRIQRSRQRGFETGEVGATFVRVDVVYKRQKSFCIRFVVLNRALHLYLFPRRADDHRFLVNRFLVPIQVLDKLHQAALVLELTVFWCVVPFVGNRDPNPSIQERQLAETRNQSVVLIIQIRKDVGVGSKTDDRPGFFRVANDVQFAGLIPTFIPLVIPLAVAHDFHL